MPATNNQFVRYLILDKLLRNPRGHYRFYDLWNAVNEEMHDRGFREVSERSLREDLRILQSDGLGFGARLAHIFEGKERVYQYE